MYRNKTTTTINYTSILIIIKLQFKNYFTQLQLRSEFGKKLREFETMASTLALHLFIPGRCIGVVEDTTNRSKIEQQSNTQVKILDQNIKEERLVAISGNLENVRNAVHLLLGLYNEDVAFKLPVAKNQMGALIGKQGCTIQSVRDESGCTFF